MVKSRWLLLIVCDVVAFLRSDVVWCLHGDVQILCRTDITQHGELQYAGCHAVPPRFIQLPSRNRVLYTET
jgi:hypothetical protein